MKFGLEGLGQYIIYVYLEGMEDLALNKQRSSIELLLQN